jgi:hypothetical protein
MDLDRIARGVYGSGPTLDNVSDAEILKEKQAHSADHRTEGQGDEELAVVVSLLIAIFLYLIGHLFFLS